MSIIPQLSNKNAFGHFNCCQAFLICRTKTFLVILIAVEHSPVVEQKPFRSFNFLSIKGKQASPVGATLLPWLSNKIGLSIYFPRPTPLAPREGERAVFCRCRRCCQANQKKFPCSSLHSRLGWR
jgi:hypothetical protein